MIYYGDNMRTLKWIGIVSFSYILLAVLLLIFLGIPVEVTQMIYLIVLASPLYVKRLANWLRLDLPWFN